jgi:hypothetical protein
MDIGQREEDALLPSQSRDGQSQFAGVLETDRRRNSDFLQ